MDKEFIGDLEQAKRLFKEIEESDKRTVDSLMADLSVALTESSSYKIKAGQYEHRLKNAMSLLSKAVGLLSFKEPDLAKVMEFRSECRKLGVQL